LLSINLPLIAAIEKGDPVLEKFFYFYAKI